MNDDPPRLREGGSAFLKAALESARREIPDAERSAALEARILPALLPPPPPPPPPPPGAELAGKALAGTAGASVGVGSIKAVGVALAAALVVAVGGASYVVTRPSSPATLAAPSVSAPLVGVVGVVGAAEAPSAAPTLLELPVAPSAATASAHAHAPMPSATPLDAAKNEASDLAAEVALLHAAQDGLRGSPAEALARANEHARRFPRGALGQEREVIAIEALVKLGRREEARARAARFARTFPGSTHQRRVDALVSGT